LLEKSQKYKNNRNQNWSVRSNLVQHLITILYQGKKLSDDGFVGRGEW